MPGTTSHNGRAMWRKSRPYLRKKEHQPFDSNLSVNSGVSFRLTNRQVGAPLSPVGEMREANMALVASRDVAKRAYANDDCLGLFAAHAKPK